ncbi:helix-turn-helix domain-containing protein [Arhodomonas sp. SL1]|uniref:helix-turn-helix domain-containing protein n=1 Tax=Arhodomonas sp. SL1 TaxID=3425691 RepID=UPI003F882168
MMLSFTDEEEAVLRSLGIRLRAARRAFGDRHRETQREFAARIGVSEPTYRRLEKGEPSVPIGYWIRALRLLGRLDEADGWLQRRGSLFDHVDDGKKGRRR